MVTNLLLSELLLWTKEEKAGEKKHKQFSILPSSPVELRNMDL